MRKHRLISDFDEQRAVAEAWYRFVGHLHCPYFAEPIVFNHKGLHHLRFKSNGEKRTIADQYGRFKYLYFAKHILQNTGTLQEYTYWNPHFTYYCFSAVFPFESPQLSFKIIVKREHGGLPYFWSIIPQKRK